MSEVYDVVVAGAGIVGCSAAWRLAERGLKVALLEPDAVGSGCSGVATGLLGILTTEVKTREEVEFCVAATTYLTALVPELSDITGMSLDVRLAPTLRLAVDRRERDLVVEALRVSSGLLDAEWLDGSDIRSEIEPRISEDVIGGAFEASTGIIDSYTWTMALAQAAEKRGVRILHHRLLSIECKGGSVVGAVHDRGRISTRSVVVATGHALGLLDGLASPPLPVFPVRGERLVVRDAVPGPFNTILTSPNHGHIAKLPNGLLSVGSTGSRADDVLGGWNRGSRDKRPTDAAMLDIMERAVRLTRGIENAEILQQVVGWRPTAMDGLPVIGPLPHVAGVFMATGHGARGILLGPLTGEIVANAVVDPLGVDLEPIRPFSPERFESAWSPAT